MFADVRATACRGRVTRRMGAGFLALVLAGAGVAACGGDDDSDAQPATTPAPAPDDAATDDTEPADTTGDDISPVGDAGAELRDLLGLSEEDATLCADETFKAGAVLALTGPGAFYGSTMSRGLDLAVEHIRAAGGPQFAIEYHDHRSGDPIASQQAITELGEGGYGAKFASYVDGLGAMFEGTANFEMFTLDGGGGTSVFGQGQPFFYGTRAITPNDALPGLFEFVNQTIPDAQTVGVVTWDIGEPSNTVVRDDTLAAIENAGLEFNGLYELTPVGSQDYSQVLPRVQSNEPDVLIAGLWGQDIGSFINQASVAGLESDIFGPEFTPDGINAAGGAFEDGYWFAYDYFEPTTPTNALAELFVSEFEAAYGELPDFYAANYYEDGLGMWDIVRRVCAEGGDINSGPALNEAFRANPTLQSVYGGQGRTPGTKTIDMETHTVIQRPMGVFEYRNGEVTTHALFDMDAADFQLLD
jgi:branched-chain amino acid transport system substrate-binding protein